MLNFIFWLFTGVFIFLSFAASGRSLELYRAKISILRNRCFQKASTNKERSKNIVKPSSQKTPTLDSQKCEETRLWIKRMRVVLRCLFSGETRKFACNIFALRSLCIAKNVSTYARKLKHYCLHTTADISFWGFFFDRLFWSVNIPYLSR